MDMNKQLAALTRGNDAYADLFARKALVEQLASPAELPNGPVWNGTVADTLRGLLSEPSPQGPTYGELIARRLLELALSRNDNSKQALRAIRNLLEFTEAPKRGRGRPRKAPVYVYKHPVHTLLSQATEQATVEGAFVVPAEAGTQTG